MTLYDDKYTKSELLSMIDHEWVGNPENEDIYIEEATSNLSFRKEKGSSNFKLFQQIIIRMSWLDCDAPLGYRDFKFEVWVPVPYEIEM